MVAETVLRSLRIERDQKIEDTAKAVGLSRSGYHQIEIGVRDAPSEVAIDIAAHFGVPLEFIFLPSRYSVRAKEDAQLG